MSTLTEKTYVGDVIRWEAEKNFSRIAATAVAVAALTVGTVMAKKTKSVVTPAISEGSTGDGALGTWTLGAKAIPGVYRLTCVAEASNAGTFIVLDPHGNRLADLTVASAYASDHINGTLADGTNDWDIGDEITITVSGDGKYYPAVYGAVDGTGEAAAILLEDLAITAGKSAALLAREAIIVGDYLVWGASYDSADKKAVALAQLAALGIVQAASV